MKYKSLDVGKNSAVINTEDKYNVFTHFNNMFFLNNGCTIINSICQILFENGNIVTMCDQGQFDFQKIKIRFEKYISQNLGALYAIMW